MSGTLWATGSNAKGELGLGDNTDRNTFTQVGTDTDYLSCSSGGNQHQLIIKENNQSFSCGNNINGALALGDNADRNIFTSIISGANALFISAGQFYSFLLRTDGVLRSTGLNNSKQLALGDTTNRNAFTQVSVDTDWKSIRSRWILSVATKTDGTLWFTHDFVADASLNLGLSPHGTFVQEGTDTNWKDAVTGRFFVAAIKTNGTLWTVGDNQHGELAQGDNVNRIELTQVGTDTDWAFICAGYLNLYAVKTNGTLWVAGDGSKGQTGQNDTADRNVLTQIGTDTDWTFINAGYSHFHAIKTNGTLWAVGWNLIGGLGLGDTTDRKILTQVGTDTDHEFIGGGDYHTFIVKTVSLYNIIQETISFSAKANFLLSSHCAYHETISFSAKANAEFGRLGNHLGLTYSPENKAMTCFNNMPFDYSCVFNGKTLFANEEGLFEYGGATDNGEPIITSIKTDKSNKMPTKTGLKNSQFLKILPTSQVYINAISNSKITLTVTTDDDINFYTLDESHPDFAIYLMNVGRGLKGVHWQLELSGCDAIESIEYELKEIRRRR